MNWIVLSRDRLLEYLRFKKTKGKLNQKDIKRVILKKRRETEVGKLVWFVYIFLEPPLEVLLRSTPPHF